MAPGTKIFVGRLPPSAKRSDLEELFAKYGTVRECDILSNYGFVHMSTPEEAQEAIKALNNYELDGTRITVEESTSRPRSKMMGGLRMRGARGSYSGRGYAARNEYSSNGSYASPSSWDRYGGRMRPYSTDTYDDRRYTSATAATTVVPTAAATASSVPRYPVYNGYSGDYYDQRTTSTADAYSSDAYSRDPYNRDAYSRYSYDTVYSQYDPYAGAQTWSK